VDELENGINLLSFGSGDNAIIAASKKAEYLKFKHTLLLQSHCIQGRNLLLQNCVLF